MRASDIRVAVRPRGVFECLDLAVMFCGRRPLAVVAATVLGSLPWVFLNRWLFAGAGDDDAVAFAPLVLGLEAAWAAVPLTLYLGQSVFSDRFSWRDAGRAFVRGLPAMVVFQGLLRGFCLMTWVLAPFLLAWHYYLDQIILLEQPPLSRVWRRRTAMNQGNVGQVTTLLGIDAATLVVGTVLLSESVLALRMLWQGTANATDDGGDPFVSTFFSWEGQIAFWGVCGFLTVFRFFTYLDARIRREGWDVELKLRSEETWAALERRPGTGRGIGAAALCVAIATLAAPAVRAAAPGDDDARRALARQSFPWYDQRADAYRPIVQAPEPVRAPSADPAPFAIDLGPIGAALVLALLVAVVGSLVFLVVRHGLFDGGRLAERSPDGGAAPTVEDLEAALPEGIRPADGDLLARAAALADSGDFAAAMLHLHAWLLVELDRRGGLTLARGKTNRQYAAEVARSMPAAADLFRSSSRLFEDAYFGHLPVSRADFAAVWKRRDLVASPLPVAAVPS